MEEITLLVFAVFVLIATVFVLFIIKGGHPESRIDQAKEDQEQQDALKNGDTLL